MEITALIFGPPTPKELPNTNSVFEFYTHLMFYE